MACKYLLCKSHAWLHREGRQEGYCGENNALIEGRSLLAFVGIARTDFRSNAVFGSPILEAKLGTTMRSSMRILRPLQTRSAAR